jgi:ATP-dependent Lon protease
LEGVIEDAFGAPESSPPQSHIRQSENGKLDMSETLTLPVLPLRETVIFPGVNSAIGAGRAATLRAIQRAADQEDKLLFAVSQRENLDEVRPEILFTIGTIARIGQLQRVSGGVQMLLHGVKRGIAMRYSPTEDHLEAVVREVEELEAVDPKDPAFLALLRELRARAGEVGQKAGFPEEVVRQVLEQVDEPGRLADLVASYLELPHAESQSLLETLSIEERLRRVLVNVQRQINVLDAQQEIKSKVQQEIGDRQREIFLREQLKAIPRELGEEEEGEEVDELRQQLESLELPAEARKEIDRELGRLGRMSRESMEYQVIRTYLETVAELPWQERSADDFDLHRAGKILEQDHYGLEEVKDRVLEFLAVRRLRAAKDAAAQQEGEPGDGEEMAAPAAAEDASAAEGDGEEAEQQDSPPPGYDDDRTHGPILLFVGPPGTGKTSIARSIARAMDRKYVRVSLGGARDEADIRGHRRTYVGAMPGRILKGMKDAGTKNPVFLLDEVDKLGVSYQGDPASALLEVLDPARPLPGRALRPVGSALHRHRELPAEYSRAAARSHGAGRVLRLHGAGEARDRAPLPGAATGRRQRPGRRSDRVQRRGDRGGHKPLYPRGRRAPARARAGQTGAEGGAPHRRGRE